MSNQQHIILIAGGTGLLGKSLSKHFLQHGLIVKTLTRGKTNPEQGLFHWNPTKNEIDTQALIDVTVIINLAGADVMSKRWSVTRKEEILKSRTVSTRFLSSIASKLPNVKHFISASGINAYGFKDRPTPYHEEDLIGKDFLSQVIGGWENACDHLPKNIIKTVLRIGVVFSSKGGALVKFAEPIKMGVGAPLGKGNQIIPWIDIDDIVGVVDHAISKGINGTYNCFSSCDTNKQVTSEIAKQLKKPLLLPNVPGWFLKLILGERSIIILKGTSVTNDKLLKTGYQFKYPSLSESIKNQYGN